MLEKVLATVRRHNLFAEKETVLVAVSGGVDSMVLLQVMLELREVFDLQLGVVHVEHGLRGDESREDALFVERTAQRLKLPFYKYEADVGALAEEAGLPIQVAARQVRYEFFARVAQEVGAQKVATAHHADDQAETVLMRVLRGTSMRGLAGIPIRREVSDEEVTYQVVRPLLEVRRAEIEEAAVRLGVSYREDASNASDKYLRNKIRIRLLPELEQDYNPNVRQSLWQLAENARDDDTFLSKLAMDALGEVVEQKEPFWRLNAGLLRGMALPLQRRVIALILYYLRGHTIQWEHVHVESVCGLLTNPSPSARVELPARLSAWREYESLCIGEARGDQCPSQQELSFPGSHVLTDYGIRLDLILSDGVAPRPRDAWEAQFDADELSRSRIYIRTWGLGDKFRPLGLSGTKLISDLFIDAKVPKHERGQWPLLCVGDSIAWAIGLRRGDVAPVQQGTKRTVTARATKLQD
ncbi:MAG TPA: tRNA lysidine(34) synthetase TilS [Bacilli bacterium]|nr:tRNA lysidine(34) synthetase TilS [Bacilli bacterium]